MARRERLVKTLMELIEYNDVAWRKAAFYSDPEVDKIYSRLIDEWIKNGEKGIPLDYATDEELEILVRVARRYAFMSEAKARALALARMGGEEEEESGLGIFSKLIDWIKRRR